MAMDYREMDPHLEVTQMHVSMVWLCRQQTGRRRVLHREEIGLIDPTVSWGGCRPRPVRRQRRRFASMGTGFPDPGAMDGDGRSALLPERQGPGGHDGDWLPLPINSEGGHERPPDATIDFPMDSDDEALEGRMELEMLPSNKSRCEMSDGSDGADASDRTHRGGVN